MVKKILAVVGATGAQGGGLVRAVLADPGGEFAVRALTRNADSDKAKALAAAGAQVAAADLDDPESLRRAFRGAHGAFCVTAFWEHFSPEKELAQAKAMAQAAKAEGVAHVIWSTLEDTRKWAPLDDPRIPTLHGKYKVPHFDAKGEADGFFKAAGVPTTFLLTSFYWENFIHFGMNPKPDPDGTLAFVLPMDDAKLPGIAVDDIGKCALGIFRKGPSLAGKYVGIAGDHLSGAEMAAAMTKTFGKTVRCNPVPPEVYRTFGFPGADDLGNMFQVKRDFNAAFMGARKLETARELNPRMLTFAQWLAVNKDRIPLA